MNDITTATPTIEFAGTARQYRSDDYAWVTGTTTFAQHMTEYPEGLASLIYREAMAEQRERDHADANREQAYRLAHTIPSDPAEQRAQRAIAKARDLVNSNAQLTRALADANARVATLQNVTADDPRLIDIWVSAAEEANSRGYCEVYDAIASHVGAPTRDELREMGHLQTPGTVYVSVRTVVGIHVDDINNYDDDIDVSSVIDAIVEEGEIDNWYVDRHEED
jgi:hypothetical protein